MSEEYLNVIYGGVRRCTPQSRVIRIAGTAPLVRGSEGLTGASTMAPPAEHAEHACAEQAEPVG